jgi:predicted NBD/HSP70 family sugar kinase
MNVTNMLKVKKLNDELIRSILFRLGPISRIDIANMLSLTPPAVTSNIKTLLEQGYIREAQKETGEKSLGRPKTALDINAEAGYLFGVEAGPYQTPVVVSNLKGQVVGQVLYPHCVSYEDFLDCCRNGIRHLSGTYNIPGDKVIGAGVCLPGLISRSGVILRNAYNLWGNASIKQDLQAKLDMRVCVENNSRSRAIAQELRLRNFKRESFLYYFVKRGVGCPLVCRTQANNDIFITNGEAGHMVIDANGPVCDACGQRGCIDSLASEWAVLHDCREAMMKGDAPVLATLCPDVSGLSFETIQKAKAMQDTFVVKEFRKVIELLAIGLAGIANVTSPDSIYVEARILDDEEDKKTFETILRQRIFKTKNDPVSITYVKPTVTSGAESAALVALKRLFISQSYGL